MTTSLTAAQLDELEAYLTARTLACDDPNAATLDAVGDEEDEHRLRAPVLRELLALGRAALIEESLTQCTCDCVVVQRGGAHREPSGFTHYSDRPCGPDILGDEL